MDVIIEKNQAMMRIKVEGLKIKMKETKPENWMNTSMGQ
jgi:hypothetical protein